MSRRAPVLALPLLLAGCIYFNAIYNARQAADAGDALRRQGRVAAAADSFALSAVKAETVLARYPRSEWRTEALYLAGRGWALAGRCEQGLPRLEEFLRAASDDRVKLDRARLAVGVCRLDAGSLADARAALEPLMASRDGRTAQEAALLAGRAALAAGDEAAALGFLSRAGDAAAQWELAGAHLGAGRWTQAESLLALRARAGDWRPDGEAMLTRLWDGGRTEGALALVERWDRSRIAPGVRARLRAEAAARLLAAGRDSAARVQLEAAARAAPDSAAGREALVRLAALDVRRATSLGEATRIASRLTDLRLPDARRLADNLLFVRMLAAATDATGASRFLAAEVARDSLGAPALAHALFAQVARDFAGSPVAPKALLAAAALLPDSAAIYSARARDRYPESPYVRANGASLDGAEGERLLEGAWSRGARALADTVSLLRRDSTAVPVATTPAAGATPPGR